MLRFHSEKVIRVSIVCLKLDFSIKSCYKKIHICAKKLILILYLIYNLSFFQILFEKVIFFLSLFPKERILSKRAFVREPKGMRNTSNTILH